MADQITNSLIEKGIDKNKAESLAKKAINLFTGLKRKGHSINWNFDMGIAETRQPKSGEKGLVLIGDDVRYVPNI